MISEIQKLFEDPVLNSIEIEITKKINARIYYHPSFLDIEVKNVTDSQLNIDVIKQFMYGHQRLIIEFAVHLLSNNGPTKSVAQGASITYSIYLIYLEEMPGKLLEYLKKRRIPKPVKVMHELVSTKQLINDGG